MTEAERKYMEEEFDRLFQGFAWSEPERATALNRIMLGWAMCRTFDALQDEYDRDYQLELQEEERLRRGE